MNVNVKLDKKKERVTVDVHRQSHDGRGIAHLNNQTIFVNGALPNERVVCQLTKKHRRYQEAEILEVLTASPERTTPPCRHFGTCGGCRLQHMPMSAQLELKQQSLLNQLQHFGRITPETWLPPLLAETIGYRRKARLGVKFVLKKNKLLIGFREASSRYLADLEQCTILHPAIGQRFSELSQLIQSLDAYDKIPQIEVAIGDKETALLFRHLEPLVEADREKLISFGKEYYFHIYLQPNPPEALQKLWPEHSPHELTYTLPDEALEFLFHPLDFTQIHLTINRLMVKQALQQLELTPTETVLDLFCGIGNFTLAIACHAKYVTGIEVSHEMVSRAARNAAHNHLSNINFYTADLIHPPAEARWLHAHYDKILLDPPRTGAKEILPYLKTIAAKRIVYVSCNPATLARDAGELVHHHGYRLAKIGMMNMFPHTAHMEIMAIFDRQ